MASFPQQVFGQNPTSCKELNNFCCIWSCRPLKYNSEMPIVGQQQTAEFVRRVAKAGHTCNSSNLCTQNFSHLQRTVFIIDVFQVSNRNPFSHCCVIVLVIINVTDPSSAPGNNSK